MFTAYASGLHNYGEEYGRSALQSTSEEKLLGPKLA